LRYQFLNILVLRGARRSERFIYLHYRHSADAALITIYSLCIR